MQIPHHRRLVFLLFLPGEFLTIGKDVYMRLFTEVPKEQKKESARSAAGRQLTRGGISKDFKFQIPKHIPEAAPV